MLPYLLKDEHTQIKSALALKKKTNMNTLNYYMYMLVFNYCGFSYFSNYFNFY